MDRLTHTRVKRLRDPATLRPHQNTGLTSGPTLQRARKKTKCGEEEEKEEEEKSLLFEAAEMHPIAAHSRRSP